MEVTAPVAPRALYLHIPFCEHKCGYCDFASIPGRRDEAAYVTALRAEIRRLAAALPSTQLDTVFVGGGTPSFIEPQRLAAVLAEVRDSFAVSAGAEITLEANPSSVAPQRAESWLAAGFNRLSLGVQSLDDDVLTFLGRVHDGQRALAALDEAAAAGFSRISADLIYAVPGLTDQRWRSMLERVAAHPVEHISCYELTVESGTPLHLEVAHGRVTPVDSEAALRQHWIAVETLQARGLEQYEVSNFARLGAECRHNLVYWHNQSYLAAGVGAHGHLSVADAVALNLVHDPPSEAMAVRYWHARGVERYLAAGEDGRSLPVGGFETVDAPERHSESVMLGLRLREGIAAADVMEGEVAPLVDAGLLRRRGDRLVTTRRGQEVLNEVALRLTSARDDGGDGGVSVTTTAAAVVPV